jgi:hypothetical protein
LQALQRSRRHTQPITIPAIVYLQNKHHASLWRKRIENAIKSNENTNQKYAQLKSLKEKWGITTPTALVNTQEIPESHSIIGAGILLTFDDLETCPDGILLHEEHHHHQFWSKWHQPISYALNIILTQGLAAIGWHFLKRRSAGTSLSTTRLLQGTLLAALYGFVHLCTRPFTHWLDRQAELNADHYACKTLAASQDGKEKLEKYRDVLSLDLCQKKPQATAERLAVVNTYLEQLEKKQQEKV